MSNTLIAFTNLIHSCSTLIPSTTTSQNRVNNLGEGLEFFIKDAYCDLLGKNVSNSQRNEAYSKTFSWLGNSSNPPDFMLKKGEAIEVKKIQSQGSELALNSSFPKNKLYSTDTRITKSAKEAEEWDCKDIVYAIGTVNNQNLKRLWLIYGDCYAANKEVYQKLIDNIASTIRINPDIEFQPTKELAKIKKVDPLGITNMRVRGMWHIQNPSILYKEFTQETDNKQYYLLMEYPKDRKRVIFVGYHEKLNTTFTFPQPLSNEQKVLKDAIWDLQNSAVPALPQNKTHGNTLKIPNHEYMNGNFSTIYMSRNRVRSWEEPSFTIQAGGRHAPIHPQAPKMIKQEQDKHIFSPEHENLYRRLSVREAARIQTFPDNFEFVYKNISDGYKMVGNAVPVKFANFLAIEIKKDLTEYYKKIN